MRRATPLVAALLAGCEGRQAVLDPAGENAERIAGLWWFMFGMGAAVWLIVASLAVYVMFIRRRAPSGLPIAERTEGDDQRARWVAGGVGATLVILIAVFVYSLMVGRSVQALGTSAPLTIEVVGHQWWWEVIYHGSDPQARFETANEVHIPADEPVRVLLRSEDVVHSFWIPNIAGKMDLIPGRTNSLWLEAKEPGVYRGQCAQFCGLQHAQMGFVVVVRPPEEFAAWAAAQQRPADPPTGPLEEQGQQVFLTRACVLCHTIRGSGARAQVGPDLTHVASRLTLAAGTLPNTIGHLGGWIANPQVIKPGNRMPRVSLEPAEFQALLAYLETLD